MLIRFIIFLFVEFLAVMFPMFLIRAIRAENKDTLDKNEILAGLSFAGIIFFIISLIL